MSCPRHPWNFRSERRRSLPGATEIAKGSEGLRFTSKSVPSNSDESPCESARARCLCDPTVSRSLLSAHDGKTPTDWIRLGGPGSTPGDQISTSYHFSAVFENRGRSTCPIELSRWSDWADEHSIRSVTTRTLGYRAIIGRKALEYRGDSGNLLSRDSRIWENLAIDRNR